MNNPKQFTIQDQIEFANLSGDFNPIHIDPVNARRSIIGQPVVHGIHSILWAMNLWCKENGAIIKLKNFKVSFPNPIFLNTKTKCIVLSDKQNKILLEVQSDSKVCTQIFFEIEKKSFLEPNDSNIPNIIDEFPAQQEPRALSKDTIFGTSGKISYYLKMEEFERLFPYANKYMDNFQIANILNTSRLVGMECPGLFSLFFSLELFFDSNQHRSLALEYEVTKFDPRFGLANIKLDGGEFSGLIKAFLRPTPVQQLDYIAIKSYVNPKEFEGQTALIVGGSRGIGELSAKILAAGGANVIITFNQGQNDALRIVKEIVSSGGQAESFSLNILTHTFDEYSDLLDNWVPTHCYFFATPVIFSGVKGLFSDSLFKKFCSFYLNGFYSIVNILHKKGVCNYFYPSTIAIDEMPTNMIEYTMAKAAGEKMCEFLLINNAKLNIYKPKLPRLATDQTVSFFPVNNLDPFTLMLEHIRKFSYSSKG